MRLVIPLLLLVTVLLAANSHAQTATLYGIVTETLDDEVYPIPFAKVSVTGEEYVSGPIVPDLEGVFKIARIPPGDYVVSVGALGFDTLQRRVTLSPGDSVEARVSLGPGETVGIVLLREYVSDAPPNSPNSPTADG